MSMMVLCGPTGAGKRTVAKKLCDDYGFYCVTRVTTHPVDGNDRLRFSRVREVDFAKWLKNGDLAEYTSYFDEDGFIYHCGTPFVSLALSKDTPCVIILEPDNIRTLVLTQPHIEFKVVMLDSKFETIEHRCPNVSREQWESEMDDLTSLFQTGFVDLRLSSDILSGTIDGPKMIDKDIDEIVDTINNFSKGEDE